MKRCLIVAAMLAVAACSQEPESMKPPVVNEVPADWSAREQAAQRVNPPPAKRDTGKKTYEPQYTGKTF